MRRWICLLAALVFLTGCVPAARTASVSSATVETASQQETGTLAVVLGGVLAYEVDSAGGSLKTAIAAADLVVFLAGDTVPGDLAGEAGAWQQTLDAEDQQTLDANWPGVYACARSICLDLDSQQGLLDDAGVTTDFSAMDLSAVPARLDTINTTLLSLQRK